MRYLNEELDLGEFIADGIEQLQAHLLKHALFQIYCELRDPH